MTALPITRVVLYKHGVGHFEREARVEGDATLTLTFKQAEVSDVLKSLTVLDLDGGHVSSVSYDSTKPLEQLLAEVALTIPDRESLVGLLPQIKGARVSLHTGVSEPLEGVLLGVDTSERQIGDGIVRVVLVSVLTDDGQVRSLDLHNLAGLQILDSALRRDLDYYLRTQLSSKKKDSRSFTLFAQGDGNRTLRLSYTVEAPVWKATYRILLGEERKSPMIQGWAVVDNTQDEDWEDVQLSLVAGLPVSFVHDLYTPRYIRRPEVEVKETTGVLPPVVEEGVELAGLGMAASGAAPESARFGIAMPAGAKAAAPRRLARESVSSTPAQVRERKIGDLFEYEIEHPVTIRRNQSALVPIVLRPFEGRSVLLYNKATRAENPMRCVEFKNTTGLTLEGGPVTVLEGSSYVGEAMLETLKPDEERLVPYAVELGVFVLDNVESHNEYVSRVVIHKGQLTAYYQQVQKTTYTLRNKSPHQHIVYLEHPRQGQEWRLVEPASAHEVTENYWRFRFTLSPSATEPFVVRQQQTLGHYFALRNTGDEQLALWIEQKYLDPASADVLRRVVALRRQAADLSQRFERLEEERTGIHTEQKRIRENLQALGDRSSEKELRERIVRTLNGQEDRLEQIEAESRQVIAERDRCLEEVHRVVGELDLEKTL
jgi:hypothetical protein